MGAFFNAQLSSQVESSMEEKSMDQEKILDKLGKIKVHMESAREIGNEAEAQAFAAMLQNLLLKHKLEMTDIQYQKEMQDEPIVEKYPDLEWDPILKRRVYKDFPDVEMVNRRREWSETLAAIVAQAYSANILVVPGRSYVVFVGHKSNVAIAEYLYIMMLRTAGKLSEQAAKAFRAQYRAEHGAGDTPKGYRESWLEGFSLRIQQRLTEERNKFGGEKSTALVRVNKEAIAVKSYLEQKKSKKADHLGGRRHYNRDGYEQGKAAADRINLKGNAVNAGNQRPNGQLA